MKNGDLYLNNSDNTWAPTYVDESVKFSFGGKIKNFTYDVIKHKTFYAVVKKGEKYSIEGINERQRFTITNKKIKIDADLRLVFI